MLLVVIRLYNVVVSYLDLGGNQLSGTIPSAMSALTWLEYVMSALIRRCMCDGTGSVSRWKAVVESWKLWWCLHDVGEGALTELPPESCSRAGELATVGVAMSRVCRRARVRRNRGVPV